MRRIHVIGSFISYGLTNTRLSTASKNYLVLTDQGPHLARSRIANVNFLQNQTGGYLKNNFTSTYHEQNADQVEKPESVRMVVLFACLQQRVLGIVLSLHRTLRKSSKTTETHKVRLKLCI